MFTSIPTIAEMEAKAYATRDSVAAEFRNVAVCHDGGFEYYTWRPISRTEATVLLNAYTSNAR